MSAVEGTHGMLGAGGERKCEECPGGEVKSEELAKR